MGFTQETDCINYQHISFHFALCSFIRIFLFQFDKYYPFGITKGCLIIAAIISALLCYILIFLDTISNFQFLFQCKIWIRLSTLKFMIILCLIFLINCSKDQVKNNQNKIYFEVYIAYQWILSLCLRIIKEYMCILLSISKNIMTMY